ncbi:MAG TPA: D-aminoacylase [Segetibacter sp.]|jgi:N-acyl-D-amino-acid deacylase
MKYLLILLFFSFIIPPEERVDLIIKNGKILDGTGNSWYYGDVAVKDGTIVKIGRLNGMLAAKEIDAAGMFVSPGFIDVHTHIEGDEMESPGAENFIYDGVTSVVTGNCGLSIVDLKTYFSKLDSVRLSVNVAALIGHNGVRTEVMGTANRDPTAEELARMKGLVAQAMKDGAVGFSTGLIYIPGTYSKTSEVVELAKVSAGFNGVYASHIRDEGDSVVFAINEAILVGKEAKMPVEISHFKVSGQQNWGRSDETLAMVAKAREEGIDVTIDQYPYTASSTSLSTLLPEWVLADGQDSIMKRLEQPAIKKQVKNYMLGKLSRRKLKHFSFPVVASFKADSTFNGKSIEEINRIKGRKHKADAEAETIIEMMQQGGAGMVFHGMSEDDVKKILKYPFNMFASDASIRIFNKGVPHPRGYGTNARVLAKYVRDEKIISLEEAVRRMTSLPADKFNLKKRGLLKEGFAADILVFNDKEVQDLSTFAKPHQYTVGFKYVIVNGKVTLANGTHTTVRNGQVLKGEAAD